MTVTKNDNDNVLPVNLQTVPKLTSTNSKLFIVLVLSIILNIAFGFWLDNAQSRAEKNREIMFVKMYPNGTWDVEYLESGNEADFFPITIDKLLSDYVVNRWGVDPHNVSRDYGHAIVFMNDEVKNNFLGTDKKQFNARKKVTEYTDRGWREKIKIRFMDHFDIAEGTFVNGNSDIYRTNVFITRTITDGTGNQKGKPKSEVVNLHWRLKSVKELKQYTRDELRANPIGIEIIVDEITADISSK